MNTCRINIQQDEPILKGKCARLRLTSKLKVLLVDDEIVFLKVAKKILEMQGAFQVDIACSVDEAKEKMKIKTYDVREHHGDWDV